VVSYKILFVDDDPDILRALGNYFEKLGHDVYRAASGAEAVALHRKVRPDVTILDLVMPGMSGMEVLTILRERRASVIMLTGQGQIETAVEAMRLGAENFLVKPVDLDHLGAVIEKAAEKSQLQRENVALRAAMRPSVKRRLARLAFVALLIAFSTGVGRAIGRRSEDARARGPIPISLDSTAALSPNQAVTGAAEGR
jgi:DNA-binding NtrC family response regulator